MKKILISALIATTVAGSAFAGVHKDAMHEKDASVEACVKAIDRSQSKTLQFAAEFECTATASDKYDDTVFGSYLKEAFAKGKTSSKDLDLLFNSTSTRTVHLRDGAVVSTHEVPTGVLAAIGGDWSKVKGGNVTVKREGGDIEFRLIRVDNGNESLIGIVPRDAAGKSAERYRSLANDEAKRAEGAARKAKEAEVKK